MSAVQPPFLLAIQPLQSIRFKRNNSVSTARARTVRVRAAKLPAINQFCLWFTKTAEVWNSRACMIGLIVELVLTKGVLQTIGVGVGKGLDLPL
uniref:Uncharacterized protein n=1 Tax=Oryza punctata TaxID=4537 RepID=A0A0E0MMD2_ORYPU